MARSADNSSSGCRRFVPALIGSAIALAILIAFVLVLLWRDGRFLTGVEGRVAAVVREVKKNERANGGTPGLINRLRYSLPSPLDNFLDRILPNRWRGESEFVAELVQLGTNAVPPLMHTVEFERSTAARRVCATALAELKVHEAGPLLMRILSADSDENARAAMAQALRQLADTNAIPALLAALEKDRSKEVRATAAAALGGMRGKAAAPMILAELEAERDVYGKPQWITVLGQLEHGPAVPALAQILNPTTTNAAGAIVAGGLAGNSYFEHKAQSEAATALAAIGGDAARQALIDRLAVETDSDVAEAICQALVRMGGPAAVAALREQLGTQSDCRPHAIRALGELGALEAIKDLVPLLADRDKDVRAAAAYALGVLGDASALEALRTMLADESTPEARSAACVALSLLGDETDAERVAQLLPLESGYWAQEVWALGYLATSNQLQVLTEQLSSAKDDNARFAAAYGLVLVGGSHAASALKSHQGDRSEHVRHAKACALLMLGDDTGLSVVRKSLHSENGWQRFGAVLAVDRSARSDRAQLLANVRSATEVDVSRFVVGVTNGQGHAALLELLQSQEALGRQYAARALVFYDDTNAIPVLRVACRDEDEAVRDAARGTLRRIERRHPEARLR